MCGGRCYTLAHLLWVAEGLGTSAALPGFEWKLTERYVDVYRKNSRGWEKYTHFLVAWHEFFSCYSVAGNGKCPEDQTWHALAGGSDKDPWDTEKDQPLSPVLLRQCMTYWLRSQQLCQHKQKVPVLTHKPQSLQRIAMMHLSYMWQGLLFTLQYDAEGSHCLRSLGTAVKLSRNSKKNSTFWNLLEHFATICKFTRLGAYNHHAPSNAWFWASFVHNSEVIFELPLIHRAWQCCFHSHTSMCLAGQ